MMSVGVYLFNFYSYRCDLNYSFMLRLLSFAAVIHLSQKNCAFLFLLELRQISTNFNKI